MESSFRHIALPRRCCGYLADQVATMEYDYVADISAGEYLTRMLANWRRFGRVLFRPVCDDCRECRAIRVVVADFQPTRSQRRVRKANEGVVELRIAEPTVSAAKLDLYDRYHAFQSENKGWPDHPARDAAEYAASFVHQPFAVEEWRYYLGRKLVGVGYVDALPGPPEPIPADGDDGRIPLDVLPTGAAVGGLSAIYYFYDPEERERGLGVWNVLCLIEEAQRRGLPYVYLGYHVAGSPSLEYKANYGPNERRGDDGVWRDFR